MSNKEHILVIDDNHESLSFLCKLMQDEGYNISPADSGELAIASLEDNIPDLILSDIRMPGMNGFEVCEKIKQNEKLAKIPVIFLSSATEIEDKVKAFEVGGIDYIIKPFNKKEVLVRVRTQLDLYRMRTNLEQVVLDKTKDLLASNKMLEQEIIERKLAEQGISLSNNRYKALFNDSPIPLWEEDFTELLSYLLKLKEKGHNDLHIYFDNNPDELAKCAGMIKILDVNQAALDLHKAKNKEQLIGNLSEIFTENSFTVFKNELLAVFEGKELFESKSEVKTLQGDLRHIYLTLKIDQSQPGKVKVLLATSDITERKLAEEALLQSEEKYRSLIDDVLDTSSVGIFILDSELKVAWINKATEKYFGIKRENVIGKDKQQLINSEIKEIFEDPEYFTKKVFNTYSNNNYIENFECHTISGKDREDRWLSHWSQPINKGLYKNGRIEQYTDITERKQAEEALKESEKKVNQINTQLNLSIDNMPTGYILWDDNFRAIEWNKAAETIFGFSRQEIIGNNPIDYIVPKEVRTNVVEVMRKLKVGETADYSAKNNNINKNGTLISCRWFNTPLVDNNGKIFAIQSIALDITQQLKGEEIIKESEENLKNTFDISPSIICKANVDSGVFIEANQAVTRILGYTVEEFKAKLIIDFVHPDDVQTTMDESTEQLEKGKEVTFFENRYLCKDGSYKWLSWYSTKANDNHIVTAVASDISERKLAEDELLKHKNNLEELVNERTKELEEKYYELERMNKLFVGRELRMVELKEKIKELENRQNS